MLQDKLSYSWNVWMESETREGYTLGCWHPRVIQNTLRAKCWSIWRSDQTVAKFSFHHDINEECSSINKQHSWGVTEKPEIFFYGPYFPDKIQGRQSDDTVIQQTQELLETDIISADWNIYIFSQNSLCLARKTEPCMLILALGKKR